MSSIVQQSSPSIQVVEKVADEKGVATTELPPLYRTIDPEALDALLESGVDRDEGIRRIQFQYEGYTVVASNDGDIAVAEDNR